MASETTHEWHLALQAPWGRSVLVAGVVVAVVALGLALWSTRRERRAGRRVVLALLRVGAVATALVLFLEPAMELEDVTRVPNHVAVVVDASQSMSLTEKAGEPTRAARAARLVAASRRTFASWREKDHRVDFYTFGAALAPATEEALARAAPVVEGATRMREALAALRARYEAGDLGGVVLVSDGIDNGRLAVLDDAAGQARSAIDAEGQDFLKDLGAPVHGVWTGRAGLRDVAVARVLADDFAFARNAVKVEAIIRTVSARAAGWAGKTLPVTLRQGGQVVRTATVTIDPDHPDQKVTFEFTPDRVGKYLYEVSTPVLDGEAIVENNTRVFLLKVIRDKIRVLQLAGRPSWDERFLRGLLKHDPNVDLISFFILRTQTDVENVSPDEMSLIPFPTDELFSQQLRSFDVVFLQNFNFGPYGIGMYLGEIKKYVEEGGGLAMIGGDLSFTQGGYARSPVADVLPVELLDDTLPDRLVAPEPLRMELTAEGRSHPITALKLGVQDNLKLWRGLPELDGVNVVARARPGATVLGVHPSLRGVDGKALPVLAVSDVGKGRSLAFMSDSSWRWGFGAAVDGAGEGDARGRAYQRFWESAIRWLVKDPELRLLRVETDQPEYGRADRIHFTVRAREPDYRPARNATIALSVARGGRGAAGGGELLSKVLHTDDEGEAELEIDPLPPGGYRVSVRRGSGGGGAGAALQAANQDDEVFLVRGAGRELEDVEARDGVLRAIAAATGGSFRGPGESLDGLAFVPPRIVKVNRYRDVELWSTWLTLLLAAACFSADWALRRRWGLP